MGTKNTLTASEIKEALKTGHKASSVLRDVLEEVSELHCSNESFSFTSLGCGECIVCISKRLVKGEY